MDAASVTIKPAGDDSRWGFACECSEESRREIEACWRWFRRRLPAARGRVRARDRATLLAHALVHDFNATISIQADQWLGISVEAHQAGKRRHSVWVECDRLEDGLLFAYRRLHDALGGQLAR